MASPVCPAWKLMSLIGLLTATEKQVHLGRLHEINPVAFEKQLEGSRTLGQTNPNSQIPPSTSKMVAGGR